MNDKDREITAVALTKSVIESGMAADRWLDAISEAVDCFKVAHKLLGGSSLSPASSPVPAGGGVSAPATAPSGGPFPTAPPSVGGPYYKVTGADEVRETRTGKKIRGFTLRTHDGTEIEAKWIEGKWDTPGKAEAIEHGDWIKGKIAHGERGNFLNHPETVARPASPAPTDIPF